MSRILSALKKLSKEPRDKWDNTNIMQALRTESDAGVVFMGTSLVVEEAVYELLLGRMIELNKTDCAALFDGHGPLTTFGDQVTIAYAFGLFGLKTRTNIDIIRAIRNAFAHSKKRLTFATKEIIDAVGLFDFGSSTLAAQMIRKTDEPKGVFIGACVTLWGEIGGESLCYRMRPTPRLA